jgi:uncharacterized protein (TIGR02996 family)
MTPEQAFLRSIKESPDDDGLRLIFADWLEENGQPERGELIRLQVEAAMLPRGDPQRSSLMRRASRLLYDHGEYWLMPWAGLVISHRGLLQVECIPSQFQERAESAGEDSLLWVERLYLFGGQRKEIQPVLNSALLRHVPALDLSHNDIGDEGVEVLAASPHLKRTASLALSNIGTGTAGAVALAASPLLTRLTSLDLRGNQIGSTGAAALAASPHLSGLTSLGLGLNGIGVEGALALAASPYLGRLTSLDVSYNEIGAEGKSRLSQRYGSALVNLAELYS